jgi:hypothetical protein
MFWNLKSKELLNVLEPYKNVLNICKVKKNLNGYEILVKFKTFDKKLRF